MYCSKCGAWAPEADSLCGACGAALQTERLAAVPPAAAAAERLAYAGFWRRAASAVVDMLVILPFQYALQYALGRDPFAPWQGDAVEWALQCLFLASSWLYSALLESGRGQGSLGQRLLAIRVCDLSGRRIGFGRATVRHFGQYLSLLTAGIGYLMIAFGSRKQALHDRIAGCLLVRPAPESPRLTLAPSPPPPSAPRPDPAPGTAS